MKMTWGRWIATAMLIVVAALSIASLPEAADKEGKNKRMDKNHIVLLGASVGKGWEIQGYPDRMKDPKHTFESMAVYQYDKTEGLEEILMRPKRKFRLTRTYVKGFFQPAPRLPGTIIIKECAAYFPGDLGLYETMIGKWIKRIKEANIEPIVATVVPVTRTHAQERTGRLEQIRQFNDWVRAYAAREKIVLLDLEKALRKDDADRVLRDELTNGDGLHLNRRAYALLDQLLQETIRTNNIAAGSATK